MIPPTIELIENHPDPERKISITLKAKEWANILRRLRGADFDTYQFWLSIGTIEYQATLSEPSEKERE